MKNLLIKTKLYSFATYLEEASIYLRLTYYIDRIKIQFHDDKLSKLYKQELKKYIEEIKKEIGIFHFLTKNIANINQENYLDVIARIQKIEESRIKYMTELFQNAKNALEINYPNKLYLPRNNYESYTKANIEECYNHAKGYTLSSVIHFVTQEHILTTEQSINLINSLREVLENHKVLTIFNYNVTDKAALENIHNLVKLAAQSINKQEQKTIIDDGQIVDLANFYKLVYKKQHPSVNSIIACSFYAITLFEAYKNEPFEEQIIKLQNIIANEKATQRLIK